MKRHENHWVYLLAIATAVLFVVIACGSSTEQADTTTPEGEQPPPGDTTETPPPEAEAPELGGWASLDFEGKRALMVEQVMPEMGTAFREFNAEEYAEFTCATCHMENFQEVNFSMPNGLAPLNPADIPGLGESSDENVARTAQFMFQTVTPGMVRILGVEPYNMETHQGFGCLSCHATAEAE
jgi:hypothetical protein